MAHSSDISSTVANSHNSRHDENLPEHYFSSQNHLPEHYVPPPDQNERSQFLPSIQSIPVQQQSWPSSHAAYVHPNDQNLKGKFNMHDVYDEEPATSQSTKIMGLARRTFIILLVTIVVIVTGAVLGGVLGSRAANHSGVTQSLSASNGESSTAISSSTSSPSSSASKSTTTPSSTATVVVNKAALKFPSLAVTHAGNNTHMFSLRSDNNSIAHHVKNQSTWYAHGALNISNVPAIATAMTAISWRDSNLDELRLYYISKDEQIIELNGRCTSATACEWVGRKVIQSSGVSETAGLAAVHWGNSSSTDRNQIRLYFASKKNSIYEQAYGAGAERWGDAKSLDAKISEGTGLSVVVPSGVDDPLQRVFCVDETGDMKCLRGEEDLTGYDVDFTNQSPTNGKIYNMTRPSSVASCLHWGGSTSSDLFISVKQISDTGDVVEAYQDASVAGAYSIGPMVDCPRGDDPGGAIAAVGYLDPLYGTNQLFVYSVGGAVTECWWHDTTTATSWKWAWTSNLIHT